MATSQQRLGQCGQPPERHLFLGARNTVLYPGTIVLLGDAANGEHTPVQTAFKNAVDITIYGGYYGTHATQEALDQAQQASEGLKLLIQNEEAALRREEMAFRLKLVEQEKKSRIRIAPPVASSRVNARNHRYRPESHRTIASVGRSSVHNPADIANINFIDSARRIPNEIASDSGTHAGSQLSGKDYTFASARSPRKIRR